MAEPSTIARPYAAALFQSSTAADGAQLVAQLDALAGIAGDAGLRQFAADPKVTRRTGLRRSCPASPAATSARS